MMARERGASGVQRSKTPKPTPDKGTGVKTPQKRSKAVGKKPHPLAWIDATVEATPHGWRFTLPVVASANRMWRTGKGRTYKSAKAEEDTHAAAWMFRHVAPLRGDLSVSIRWHRSQKSGDVDNRIKATLDILRGIAYVDDAAVARVSCERVDDGTPARLVVDVTAWREAA